MILALSMPISKKIPSYWYLFLSLFINTPALANTDPFYIAAVGDSITVGVDGNANTKPADHYVYSSAVIKGNIIAKQTYQTRIFGNTSFAPGGYREALVQLMCNPNLSISFTTDPSQSEITVNSDPTTSIASHFQCDASTKQINYIDQHNQKHTIKFLGNTKSNPLGGDPNNLAPGLSYFTSTQTFDANHKSVMVDAPYFANQAYTLCDSTHNCPLSIASLFKQPMTPIPQNANVFAITLAGTNDIMMGFDTFDDLKNDLRHLINITLPQYLNPQQNNTLYHIVSPITPVANSGCCKMITPDGCADITYNRYILNTSKSLSSPSLTQDILAYNADTHISIAQPNIPVNGYHYNVHPDIENYLYLGYNIANALLKNFQLATTTMPYIE